MKTNYCKTSTHSSLHGFSLVEILVALAAMSTLCGVGMVAARKTQEAGQRNKLESDVAVLNRSVRVYLGNGGTLPKEATSSEVLARLKTKVSAAEKASIVGHTGPFLDPRVRGVAVDKKGGSMRAVWDAAGKRFVIGTTGDGFSEFVLDSALCAKPIETESRETVEKFAKHDAWVWDYDGTDTAAAQQTPTDTAVALGSPVVFEGQSPSAIGRLQPPTFSVPQGLYAYGDFPMPVSLIDPNPKGTSEIYYSVNNGPWTRYAAGSTFNLPSDQLNTLIQTYAAPIDSEKWVDSSSATNLYQTIFFKGSTSGLFTSPDGDPGLVTNLSKKLKLKSKHFDWGTPSISGTLPNALDFTGVSSFFALPEQEFKIGDISYYNGTTYAGTNATTVQMEVALNLTVPQSTEVLSFGLKLQSTPNKGWSKDADADYVWIPTLSSKFSTTVQGQTFYLQLRFGPSDADSFTTIDEFHVHEGKKATGTIYGKLTTKPVL